LFLNYIDMGSGIFYSNKANTKNNVKKSRLQRMSFFALIALFFTMPFSGKAQTPSFVNGATQNIAMCVNTVSFDIDSYLGVIDVVGATDTWTFGSLPTHGSLTGTIATSGSYSQFDASNPNNIPAGNALYSPFGGYTGSDTFSVVVTSSLGGTATIIFYVNVLPIPALTLGTQPVVCAGVTSTSIPYSGLTGLGPVSQNFNFTGGPQTYVVPAGITSIMFDAAGGNGGSDDASGAPNPGLGGRIQGTLNVAPGSFLNIYVGGKGFDGSPFGAAGGYNGGGSATDYPGTGCGGAGGGGSDIRLTGNALTDRVIVAGGGGGNGFDSPGGAYAGGNGGGLSGANSMPNVGGSSAMGGTQVGGGAHAILAGWLSGGDGVARDGGNGSIQGVSGGGGGGYFGGGGGVWNGGGGGSSFADPVTTTLVTNTQGGHIGNGYVTLTYINAGTYSINWDPAAITAGFVNVPATAMPAGAFPVTVPPAAPANVYTGTLTVTNGVCSTSYPISVTVNPIPDIDPATIPNQGVCNGMTVAATNPSGSVGGTTFSWTNDNTSIGLAASGTGSISSFTGTNATAIPQVADITYTDTAAGCAGAPATFTITVNPTPMLLTTTVGSQCDATTFNYTASSATPGASFTWYRPTMTGLSNPLPGSGFTTISEVPVDTLSVPLVVPYTYTVTANGCNNPQTLFLTVEPFSLLTSAIIAPDVCSGAAFTYTVTATTDPFTTTTFTWTRDSTPGITKPAGSGTGNINDTLNNISDNAVNVIYTYYAKAYGCITPNHVFVNVNAIPKLSSTLTPPAICYGNAFNYNPTTTTHGATTFKWDRIAIPGILESGNTNNGNPNEVLHDTATFAIGVPYRYQITSAFGCMNTEYVVVDVRPNPILSGAHTDVVCSGAPYNYTATSATTGTTFQWSRASVFGISNGPNSQLGNISETLTNTTDNPVMVKYAFNITDSGCFNNDSLWLTVNPTPRITSSLKDTSICDSTRYMYTPAGKTPGSVFTWSRVYVGGISNSPATGTGPFNEELTNTTNVDVTATYLYMVSANGCAGTPVKLHVTVHPTPKLTGDHNFITCSGTNFNYDPQSNVAGTTYKWTRGYVLGISPKNNFGTGNDVLVDSVFIPLTTKYYYQLSANGCTNVYPEEVDVLINPAPNLAPGIITNGSNSPCSNTLFQTFGAATPPPAGETYSWTASNATVYATSPNEQYAYVNFYGPGMSEVFLHGRINATGCTAIVGFLVNVGTGVSDNPQVIYFQGQFVALENDEDSYQWGYDNATTFAPTVISGATQQNYYDPNPDFVHNRYWVITIHNGCINKTYYNQPTGVANVNSVEGEMKVYPNPASSEVTVAINTPAPGEMQVEVLNMLGQKIAIVPTVNKEVKINVAGLPSGCYLVECYREGAKIATTRFIKN
jgi:hypothetical protein